MAGVTRVPKRAPATTRAGREILAAMSPSPYAEPMPVYTPDAERYDQIPYRRCGRSGLDLPAISLGLWQNFGGDTPFERQRAIVRRAFDLGITHIDLANNYGPPPGSAEENFGRIL